jgi:hypothetical protein
MVGSLARKTIDNAPDPHREPATSASKTETDFAILDEVDFEPLSAPALAAARLIGRQGAIDDPSMVSFRIAVEILARSRPEIVEAARELTAIEGPDGDDDMLLTILRRLGAAAAMFRSVAELIETAEERLFAAAHIVTEPRTYN